MVIETQKAVGRGSTMVSRMPMDEPTARQMATEIRTGPLRDLMMVPRTPMG